MKNCCSELSNAIASSETSLCYVPKFREYGISVLDGGSSYLIIEFCPFCGKTLPGSLRSEWFSHVEELDLEPNEWDSKLPEKFKTDAWWNKAVKKI